MPSSSKHPHRRRPSSSTAGGVISCWADLAEDHLVDIFGRLHTLQDFFAVRAVCRSWRNAAKPSPSTLSSQSPLLVVTRYITESLFDIVARRSYSFKLPWAHPHRFAIGYSQGHIITSTPTDRDNGKSSILLRDLFTGAAALLPPIPYDFDRVIVSSRPDSAHCLVVLFHMSSNYIQFIKVDDPCWTVVDSFRQLCVRAMMFFQGELLGLTGDMELVVVELMEKPLRVRKLGGRGDFNFAYYWLGEWDGVLLAVVCSYPLLFKVFKVFQWNLEKKEWEEIHDLGDKALFVSRNGDLTMISSTGLELRKNCVYFTDFTNGWVEFSLQNKTYTEFRSPKASIPVWVFPNKYVKMNLEYDGR